MYSFQKDQKFSHVMWMSPQKDRFLGKVFFLIDKNYLFLDTILKGIFVLHAAGDQMLTQGVSTTALQLVFCDRVSP